MDKLKRYLIYIVLLILFGILSELLISVGINSTYKPMEKGEKSDVEQIEIYQAEATKVNGRIRGLIRNKAENKLNYKYIKFNFYTARGVNMGSKYIEIDSEKEEQPIELFFKLNNVTKYEMELVNEKEEKELEIELLPKDLNKTEILITTLVAVVFFT